MLDDLGVEYPVSTYPYMWHYLQSVGSDCYQHFVDRAKAHSKLKGACKPSFGMERLVCMNSVRSPVAMDYHWSR